MHEEAIIQSLKEKGYRITEQRRLLLNVILSENTFCCKEIYYKARQNGIDASMATVYRTVRLLEDMGAVTRNSAYNSSYSPLEAPAETKE